MVKLRQFGYRLLSAPYKLIFKEKMGREAQQFFVSTSQVAVGTLAGALVTLVLSIIAARALGPDDFGSFSIIVPLITLLWFDVARCDREQFVGPHPGARPRSVAFLSESTTESSAPLRLTLTYGGDLRLSVVWIFSHVARLFALVLIGLFVVAPKADAKPHLFISLS